MSPPPHASSTLVNVSDDADLRLIRLLAPSTSAPAAFESTCASCIASGDAAGLIRAVVTHPGAVVGLLELDSVDESVSAFSLLAALLDRVGNDVIEKELVMQMADSLAVSDADGESAARREKRSAMAAALFNLRSDGIEKTRLLARIVDLADADALSPGSSRGTSALADALNVEALNASLKLWGAGGEVPDVERRTLFKAVVRGMDRVLERLAKDERAAGASDESDITRKINAAKKRRQTYLLLLLDTYKEESQIDKEALTYAQEAAIGAILDPITLFSSQRRLLNLPAISALQTKSSHPALYDLLKVFQEGKLQDYRDFTAMPDKATVMTTFGLDEESCSKNMRLLSLVSLAGEHEEIPYSAIATTLDVPEDQVETWVISGVGSGLMEAKMDQLLKVVLVERCAVRQFGSKEWGALKARLDTWKANVRGVLEGLQKSGAVVDGQ